ncbi:cytochrome P450 [Kineococcus sp. R8]|uniref:cytochrome P450 n=1 Tax=Kineococcus siccus TaxID=2696567 RepID=UPI001413731E|nr:cytochrome P450 [Kineococcus siccus]NAZ80438.1 cytochrome P450 [Kineococcus siccus]
MTTPNTCPVTGTTDAPVDDAEPLRYPMAGPTALEPPVEWAWLRERCPVAPVRLPSGDTAVLLTRHDDVKAMLSDPRFTRELVADDAARVGTAGNGAFEGRGAAEESVAGPEVDGAGGSTTSGPGHQRWRRLLGRSFTVKRVMALQPRIVELTDELIDAMVAGGPTADLRSALGFPLPVNVICELLGVPADRREEFAYWSDTMLNLTRYEQAEIQTSAAEFQAYMVTLVQAKRAEPGDDLLSELAAVVDAEDGRMSEAELVATGQGLLIAGHETTANMIGKMVSLLLAEPARWRQLLADPGLVGPAVEEVLRFDANPGFGMPRYVSAQMEIAGTTVAPGTTVISSMAAANRDERVFPDAARMDLTRQENPHLAFGAGPHSCIGQALARVELQTVLGRLLERLPTLELAVTPAELRRREGLIVGGLEEVPVRW